MSDDSVSPSRGRWSIHGIGRSAGSDHRLIWADVSIKLARRAPSLSAAEGDDREVVGL